MTPQEFGPRLTWPTPLSDTLGKTELEQAAGLMILAHGECTEWGWITEQDIVSAAGSLPSHVLQNPFFKPDFRGLADRRVVESKGFFGRMRFTSSGLELLANPGRWRVDAKG